jgi:hypothetical protein
MNKMCTQTRWSVGSDADHLRHSSLSLIPLLFLTGFFSKDFILQYAFGTLLGFYLPPQSKVVLNAHEPDGQRY